MNGLDFVIESIATDSVSVVLLDPSSQLVTVGAGDTVTVAISGFPLRKTYPAIAGTDYVRTISKPVSGATRIYQFGFETAHTLNTTTGFFTLNSLPVDGAPITADYLFDVPVRFDNDHFSSSLEHSNLSDWNGITLVEVREL